MLLAEHKGSTMSLFWFLGPCLIDAINDFFQHSKQPAPDLYDRFLGWVRDTDPGASSAALCAQTAPVPGQEPDSRHEVNLR
ncbi:hypothetical protein [Actinoplanes sp. NPDC049802]|uniref:hypothetical protein n=1 Tax=Actinoplanes sp. NPDC049802 TaxID=3154742 RepID=UPI0033C0088C